MIVKEGRKRSGDLIYEGLQVNIQNFCDVELSLLKL